MSYCPKCNDNVEIVTKTNIGKAAFKAGSKVAVGTMKLGNQILDESQRELDKGQDIKDVVEARHYQRRSESHSVDNLNQAIHNKMGDAILGSDQYYACASCGAEIHFPDCQNRSKYLVVQLDHGTANSPKWVAGLSSIVGCAIATQIPPGFWMFITPFVFAGAGYALPNVLGFKARAYINLIISNVKAVVLGFIGAVFLMSFLMMGIHSIFEPSSIVLRNSFTVLALLFVHGSFGYGLYLLNKERIQELKETFVLIDSANEESKSGEEQAA